MKPTYQFTLMSLALMSSVTSLQAYPQEKKVIKITHSKRKDVWSAEKQLKSFNLPEGFVIELVASEENGIINPIDLTFDDAGRLWTQTAEMYPRDPFGDKANRHIRAQLLDPESKITEDKNYQELLALYQLRKKGTDRILRIDEPSKKVEGQVPVVADGLTMPQSILPYKNGVYVAHGSEMLFLEDADNDGKYEKANSVLTGFSFIDSHTMSHSLVRGPGGWVHFSHGAMNLGQVKAVASGNTQQINYSKIARFSLDGNDIELVSSGLNNIWGFQLRADGQWYGSEANDKSHSVVQMEPMSGFLGIGNDSIKSYQPMMPAVHPFRVGGTGLSGLVFSDDDSNTFPEKWRNVAFLANPITNTINTVKVERDASGKITGTHLEDLLKCDDEWFRPVNMEFGPDGCLYVADWYNKVVSHNEVDRSDPTRDKTHGRIWRIRHKDQKSLPIPNLIKTKDADLAKHLLGASRWEKRAAWHQISDRQVKSVLPEIKEIALNTENSVSSRIHAIFAYESLGEFDEAFTAKLLKDSNYNVRRESVRALASFQIDSSTVIKLLKPLVSDKYAEVRSQVLRTLEEVKLEELSIVEFLVSAIEPEIPGNALGGSYERNFERYLIRKALESYKKPLSTFLNSEKAVTYPVGSLLWASQALNPKGAKTVFVKFWKLRGDKPLDGKTLASISHLLNDKSVMDAVASSFKNPAEFKNLLQLTLDNKDKVHGKNLAKPLEPALKAMLKSDSLSDQKLALKVANIVKPQSLLGEIRKLTIAKPELLNEALTFFLIAAQDKPAQAKGKKGKGKIKKAPAQSSAGNTESIKIVKELAKDEKLTFNQRLRALAVLNIIDPSGAKLLTSFVNSQPEAKMGAVTSILSQSAKGATTLEELLKSNKIKGSDFDLSGAQRFNSNSKNKKISGPILSELQKAELAQRDVLNKKVDGYVASVEKGEGNAESGKATFTGICLQCHGTLIEGKQLGYDIAPALDGSAKRELHALLTAIVNPDVAVEGGYNLHQIVRKDGAVFQGYLYSDNAQGMTVAAMGNGQTFVARDDIQFEAPVAGKSFMTSFDLGEQSMLDLITYIKTELN